MTNLEFFKDKIIKETEKNDNLICAICLAKNKECVNEIDEDCPFEKDLCNWLCKEHKEKIPLKQWEYDLIHFYNENSPFYAFSCAWFMKSNKRHFKGVTKDNMPLKEILDNCKIVPDDYDFGGVE